MNYEMTFGQGVDWLLANPDGVITTPRNACGVETLIRIRNGRLEYKEYSDVWKPDDSITWNANRKWTPVVEPKSHIEEAIERELKSVGFCTDGFASVAARRIANIALDEAKKCVGDDDEMEHLKLRLVNRQATTDRIEALKVKE